MVLKEELTQYLGDHNNMITAEAALALGATRPMLSAYVKEGLLKRIHAGIYCLPEEKTDLMAAMSLSSSYFVFSHTTALALAGVITDSFTRPVVTIPSNVCMPGAWKDESIFFYVKPELYETGLTSACTPLGNMVPAYDAERAVCDLMRSRNRFEIETIVECMKAYAAYPEKDLRRLAAYARQFRVRGELQRYMDILL